MSGKRKSERRLPSNERYLFIGNRSGRDFDQQFHPGQIYGHLSFYGRVQKDGYRHGHGVAVTFVMALASAVTWAVDHYILTPLSLGYMQTAAFILIIAAIVQVVEMF